MTDKIEPGIIRCSCGCYYQVGGFDCPDCGCAPLRGRLEETREPENDGQYKLKLNCGHLYEGDGDWVKVVYEHRSIPYSHSFCDTDCMAKWLQLDRREQDRRVWQQVVPQLLSKSPCPWEGDHDNPVKVEDDPEEAERICSQVSGLFWPRPEFFTGAQKER